MPTGPGLDPVVYRLRVVLAGISPLIWRRLVVPETITIARLHEVLQVAFDWSGEHLHRFTVHGKDYGIAYICGISFEDDSHQVQLADLGLRVGERFVYGYDLTDLWRHDLRVEAIEPAHPGRAYPQCTGGARTAPPEDCGGPFAFLALRQEHSLFATTLRIAELLPVLLEDPAQIFEYREELGELVFWAGIDRFDRAALNQTLAGHPKEES
jgi:hypothetical protein